MQGTSTDWMITTMKNSHSNAPITLNAYCALVEESYFRYYDNMGQWQIDYFSSDEAKSVMKSGYEQAIRAFIDGEIDYIGLTEHSPGGTAYVLHLMAE